MTCSFAVPRHATYACSGRVSERGVPGLGFCRLGDRAHVVDAGVACQCCDRRTREGLLGVVSVRHVVLRLVD
jgi:hypothetical protein